MWATCILLPSRSPFFKLEMGRSVRYPAKVRFEKEGSGKRIVEKNEIVVLEPILRHFQNGSERFSSLFQPGAELIHR